MTDSKPQNQPKASQPEGAIPSDASAERTGDMGPTTVAAQRLSRGDSKQHSIADDRKTVRYYLNIVAEEDAHAEAIAALDRIEEQLEAAISPEGWEDMRQYNIRLEEQLRTAETTLAHAEEFIEHQDMSYRWSEWCEGRNPATSPFPPDAPWDDMPDVRPGPVSDPASEPEVASKTWYCKIGETDPANVPQGGDFPMRRAIEKAYHEITGEWPDFIFSGWGAQLTEGERAVVERDDSYQDQERS